MTTRIVCSGCGRLVRIITPAYPSDRDADFRDALRARARIGRCPECRDIGMDVEQVDMFNRVSRRSCGG